jgi:hypothetical protein
MAEDDKYVPSGGNSKLDPTNWVGNMTKAQVLARDAALVAKGTYHNQVASQSQQLASTGASKLKEIEDFNASQAAGRAGLLNSRMVPEGYEIGDGGVLRNKGYRSTKGYQAKEQTRMERAHITERTWGKYNREQAKKSQITASISPDYGHFKPKSPVMAGAAGSVAGGLNPWIGRFNPTACGPVLVSTYGFSGGVIQSNAQEAANNGLVINSISHWT